MACIRTEYEMAMHVYWCCIFSVQRPVLCHLYDVTQRLLLTPLANCHYICTGIGIRYKE